MSNIGYFEIPADDVDRAKRFYHALLGWKIEPTKTPMDPAMVKSMQYQDVITGTEEKGTISWGGMYKRQMSEPIMNYVLVENIDKVLSNVEKLGVRSKFPKGKLRLLVKLQSSGILREMPLVSGKVQ